MVIANLIKKRLGSKLLRILIPLLFILLIASYYVLNIQKEVANLTSQETRLKKQLKDTSAQLKSREEELNTLQSEDQYVVNKKLMDEINNIRQTYKKAVSSYEKLLELKELSKGTQKFDEQFTKALTLLSDRKYASAEAELVSLEGKIQTEKDKIASSFTIPANVSTSNNPPSSGYNRQQVKTDIGNFLIDIISADLSSTRVIVDTASDSDCDDNCPVLSLGDYAARNGAFAGINGSYFCPATYPTCTGKTNTFDTLLMNKNKVYFNSDNNVYSTVPAAIFGNGWIRFVGQSLEWGRDTGVDGVIANQPLLLMNQNIMFGGDDDPKKGSKGGRSFVGNKGNTVYIGVVHSATVSQAAHTLKALGLENALNLDDGGSTALWYSGYKAGPGRNIPNAILFVKK